MFLTLFHDRAGIVSSRSASPTNHAQMISATSPIFSLPVSSLAERRRAISLPISLFADCLSGAGFVGSLAGVAGDAGCAAISGTPINPAGRAAAIKPISCGASASMRRPSDRGDCRRACSTAPFSLLPKAGSAPGFALSASIVDACGWRFVRSGFTGLPVLSQGSAGTLSPRQVGTRRAVPLSRNGLDDASQRLSDRHHLGRRLLPRWRGGAIMATVPVPPPVSGPG